MKWLYKTAASYEEGVESPLPGNLKKFSVAWAAPVYRRYPGFSLLTQELALPRFGLSYWRLHCEREILLDAVADKPTLALCCMLEGNTPWPLPGSGEQLLTPYRYAIFYTAAGASQTVIRPGVYESLHLDFQREYLDGLGDQLPGISELLGRFDRGSSAGTALAWLAMNYVASAIVRSIRQCTTTGGELRLQMEKYLLGLLSEYVNQLQEKETEKKLPFASHKAALVALKEEILRAPNVHAHTITSLARSAGLSETALKKNFTLLFAEPVGVFVRRHALQKAKYLLETTTRSIDDIADEVGYSSFTNFATPFRKAFGCTPRQLRDSRLILPHQKN